MTINNALTTAPLFFVRSGVAGVNSSWNAANSMNYPGYGAWYWSRSSRDSNSAFDLAFDNSNVHPSNYTSRYYGFSLRCLYAI